jgi:hypothetical protein
MIDRVPRAVATEVRGERLRVMVADGRELSVPLDGFAWLAGATPDQRADLELIEGGEGIWWNQLEDGVSVPGLFGLPHS